MTERLNFKSAGAVRNKPKPQQAADETPEFLLFVVKEVLSDKSEVFNVIFGQHKFAATSRKDAEELAEKIVNAINDHTCNAADVIFEF